MFEEFTRPRPMSRAFRCGLLGLAMTLLAWLGPWRWPGWPALILLDFILARAAPSVAGPVMKGLGLVVLLFVNAGFWGVLACVAVRAGSLALRKISRFFVLCG
jgi:hypothetical protein